MKGLIFTWLLTALGVGGCIITPYYGFLAYVALALLRPDFLWAHSISGGRFSFIVATAMLISWSLRGFGRWDLGRAKPVVLLFIGFWLWSVFGAFRADSPSHAWYYVDQIAKILLPFLVGITSVRSVDDLKKLAWVIVICEGYVCFEMNMYYFSGFNYLWEIGFGSVDNNSAAIGFVAALGVAFFLFLNTAKLWQQLIIGGCMACILHAILFSFSRGAMLATIIGIGLSFFLIRRTAKHYALFAVGVVAALILAGPDVRDRFWETFTNSNGQREASAQSRLDLWKDCYTVLKRDPIMGCGPDHWPLLAHTFGWPKGKEAHSLWVQTATELGIPGITLFAGFYLTCIIRCWLLLRRLDEDQDPWFADSCRMTIAALTGFGVAAQFVSLEALEVPYYVALLGAGGLVIHNRVTREALMTEASEDEPAEPAVADWRDMLDRGAMTDVPADLFADDAPVGILN